MTIIVFNKPLNEINEDKCRYPLFSIYTDADVDIKNDFVEVLGRSVDKWHGLKVEMEHVASVYTLKTYSGMSLLENGWPKTNNTCS